MIALSNLPQFLNKLQIVYQMLSLEFIEAAATIIFVFSMLYAYFVLRQRAPNNPWGAGATTLEWTLTSPPAFHSYETLPKIEETAHH